MARMEDSRSNKFRILLCISVSCMFFAGCAGDAGGLKNNSQLSTKSGAPKAGERPATTAERKKHAAFLRKASLKNGDPELFVMANRIESGEAPFNIVTGKQPPKKPASRLFSCIKVPVPKKVKDKYSLIFKISLSSDGRLKQAPEVVTSLRSPLYKKTAAQIVREIRRCQPYKLSRISKNHLHKGTVVLELSSSAKPSPSNPRKAIRETRLSLK